MGCESQYRTCRPFGLSKHPNLDEYEITLRWFHVDYDQRKRLNNHWMLLLQYRHACNTLRMSQSSTCQSLYQHIDYIASKRFQIIWAVPQSSTLFCYKMRIRKHSWESEWYWSKFWNANLTTYGNAPVSAVFPPMSRFVACLWTSRLFRLWLIEHVVSSKLMSFGTSKKHNSAQSRSSVSSVDPSWVLSRMSFSAVLKHFLILNLRCRQK